MRFKSRMVAVSWIGLMTVGLPLQAEAQVRRFDGTWSVEVVTEQGACDRAYRYSIVIENGQARYGGPEAFAVSGRVQANGTVAGSISRGQDRANVTGRLGGGTGTGTWTTSGGRNCSGRWNAEKRG
ncbi:MAG TPA: hypothetical protein VIL09_11700 [Microvirga sp.]|jgi:hypothetical protein